MRIWEKCTATRYNEDNDDERHIEYYRLVEGNPLILLLDWAANWLCEAAYEVLEIPSLIVMGLFDFITVKDFDGRIPFGDYFGGAGDFFHIYIHIPIYYFTERRIKEIEIKADSVKGLWEV